MLHREHQQPCNAKGIFHHIQKCPVYAEYRKNFSPSEDTKNYFNFFKTHFKILKKGFRSLFEQKRTEAFFIRTLRPGLNDQKDHYLFKLF